MIRIYICDDEKRVAEEIHHYVTGYFIAQPTEYEVVEFYRGEDLLSRAKKERAELIFLDIDLKDSHGIQIAQAIRQFDKKVKIVFITNHTNYKGQAFSVHAFGYIDKPVDRAGIYEQLDEVKNYLLDEKNDVIFKFDTTEGLIELELKDILYFVNENRKVSIVTLSGQYAMKQKISTLEKQLLDYHFKSPHASFLVNLDYVTDIKNYNVYMIEGIEIPLSQRKSIEFRKAVSEYLAQIIRLCKEVSYD
ncbi:response regulator transcription factor [Enterococcus sp. 669A]|uniref:Response regulator transcription factor n=1 Tax=Candidatus Enterococcus moelleringii TaxID=2815325 RepID=A0ABS3LC29_9ENTE|nr:LytTR family DNA-binding domain-containing protein [Enterococcus sp. 669A]MBO1307184.1 response regulator transcription factor [Enterococcus sp. 669A]